ncbi:MAG: DinB family protein [Acidobacteriia bacterium]|nr:DinB family protein [Terriglobia bacterium]
MRKSISILALAVLASLAALPALAQEAAKKQEAPTPAPSAAQAVLARWDEAGRKLIAMAEDFPEDKYDFKPTPEVRSFAEQLLHVSAVNYFLADAVKGTKDGGEGLPRDKYKTKADVVAAVKKSFADGAEVLKAKGDAGLAAEVKHPFANALTRVGDLADMLSAHAQEHYGQLVVYYRLNKLVPPESRPRK